MSVLTAVFVAALWRQNYFLAHFRQCTLARFSLVLVCIFLVDFQADFVILVKLRKKERLPNKIDLVKIVKKNIADFYILR